MVIIGECELLQEEMLDIDLLNRSRVIHETAIRMSSGIAEDQARRLGPALTRALSTKTSLPKRKTHRECAMLLGQDGYSSKRVRAHSSAAVGHGYASLRMHRLRRGSALPDTQPRAAGMGKPASLRLTGNTAPRVFPQDSGPNVARSSADIRIAVQLSHITKATVAATVPARRAASTDPMRVPRME
jgi:hypothetical protein